jgi:hypothetical protein
MIHTYPLLEAEQEVAEQTASFLLPLLRQFPPAVVEASGQFGGTIELSWSGRPDLNLKRFGGVGAASRNPERSEGPLADMATMKINFEVIEIGRGARI